MAFYGFWLTAGSTQDGRGRLWVAAGSIQITAGSWVGCPSSRMPLAL